MVYPQEMSLVQAPYLVQKAAQLIRLFSRQEKIDLLKLVPELKMISSEEDDEISVEQRELATYFEQKRDVHPATRPSQPNAQFLGGLTFEAFLDLDEPEQSHLWNDAHNKAAKKLENYEHPVRENAIPA